MYILLTTSENVPALIYLARVLKDEAIEDFEQFIKICQSLESLLPALLEMRLSLLKTM